jgi:menaquinone-dependent protoporphyrinogen IX oxidase
MIRHHHYHHRRRNGSKRTGTEDGRDCLSTPPSSFSSHSLTHSSLPRKVDDRRQTSRFIISKSKSKSKAVRSLSGPIHFSLFHFFTFLVFRHLVNLLFSVRMKGSPRHPWCYKVQNFLVVQHTQCVTSSHSFGPATLMLSAANPIHQIMLSILLL